MSEGVAHGGESLSDELLLFCQSDSISMEGLRQIFESYGMTANDSGHINDYKFFLHACSNEHVDEELIRCLIEFFPDATSAINVHGITPLHFACSNKSITPSIIQLLIKANPSSCQVADENGDLPLHYFCAARSMNDSVAVEILKILLKECASSTQHANNKGMLPIHCASITQSPEFCGMLINAYPGSERMRYENKLPFHFAVMFNDIATVKHLYKQYPDAINFTMNFHRFQAHPIYAAIMRLIHEYDFVRRGTVDIVRFLLKCDPNIKFQNVGQMNLLSYACGREFDYSNIDEGIKVIEAIYDAHPELINDDELGLYDFHERVKTFLNGEFVYARQAKDQRMMTTLDEKGQLPLHRAPQNNARLGSIKLLVDGNPSQYEMLTTTLPFPCT